MIRIYVFGLLALLVMCQYKVLGQDIASRKPIIVIDPGHGGSDWGALGINGIQEKDVVLKIVKEMVHLNATIFENQLDIYLTRSTDTLISLGDRTKLAKILQADVFVSLHCNHSTNLNARGIEVYVANRKGEFLKESIFFAYEIQNRIQKRLGFESRGVKFANFQVLRETVDYFPSILIELGFLSNWDEETYLQKEENLFYAGFIIIKILMNLF